MTHYHPVWQLRRVLRIKPSILLALLGLNLGCFDKNVMEGYKYIQKKKIVNNSGKFIYMCNIVALCLEIGF